MRTSRVRRRLGGPTTISPIAARSGWVDAWRSSGANSGATAASSWPSLAIRSMPNSSSAARLGSSMRPLASRPITPAETPASTVSVKRRRSSIWL